MENYITNAFRSNNDYIGNNLHKNTIIEHPIKQKI